jgi:hypothetical protein
VECTTQLSVEQNLFAKTKIFNMVMVLNRFEGVKEIFFAVGVDLAPRSTAMR